MDLLGVHDVNSKLKRGCVLMAKQQRAGWWPGPIAFLEVAESYFFAVLAFFATGSFAAL